MVARGLRDGDGGPRLPDAPAQPWRPAGPDGARRAPVHLRSGDRRLRRRPPSPPRSGRCGWAPPGCGSTGRPCPRAPTPRPAPQPSGEPARLAAALPPRPAHAARAPTQAAAAAGPAAARRPATGRRPARPPGRRPRPRGTAQPAAAAPARPAGRPASWACVLTWVFTARSPRLFVTSIVRAGPDPDLVLDKMHEQNPDLAYQGVSDHLILVVCYVTCALLAAVVGGGRRSWPCSRSGASAWRSTPCWSRRPAPPCSACSACSARLSCSCRWRGAVVTIRLPHAARRARLVRLISAPRSAAAEPAKALLDHVDLLAERPAHQLVARLGCRGTAASGSRRHRPGRAAPGRTPCRPSSPATRCR